MNDHRGTPNHGGLIGGGIIIVVGTLFLLDNMGILSVGHLIRFWPLLLVASGLASMISPQGRIKGVILIVVGTLLQLDSLGIAHFRWSSLWPLALIGAGLAIVWGTFEARRTGADAGDPRNSLNEFALFGGCERRITSTDFKGGTVNVMFGGVELDLRGATIAGDQAEITINAVCAGCEIKVPDNWEIVSQGQGIFGAFVDSTRDRGIPIPPGTPRKALVLRGAAVFGGVEIKN